MRWSQTYSDLFIFKPRLSPPICPAYIYEHTTKLQIKVCSAHPESKEEDMLTRLVQNSHLFPFCCVKVKHAALFKANEFFFSSFGGHLNTVNIKTLELELT